MKCLTIQIDRVFMSSPVSPGMMLYVKNHSPSEATDGISIHTSSRVIRLDAEMIVNVSPDLIHFGLISGDVVIEGERLRILRASVRLGPDGFFELIPQHENDKDEALVFFDVGSGGYNSVEYVASPFNAIASGVTNCLPFFGMEMVLLAALKPGSHVLVNRYSPRWFIFGKDVLREQLVYKFDGNALKLQ